MIRLPWIVISAQMLSHCVYVWKKSNPDGADFVMYVGVSSNGIRRFAGHQTLPTTYEEDDYIEFFPCKSRADALELERALTAKLQPQLNKRLYHQAQ